MLDVPKIEQCIKFLDFLGYQGTKEEKACAFAAQSRTEPPMRLTLKFQTKREEIDLKETTIGTVRNYVKNINLFRDMADCGYLGQNQNGTPESKEVWR